MSYKRRDFLSAIPLLGLTSWTKHEDAFATNSDLPTKQSLPPYNAEHLRLSLNAYSFNDMLMKKQISKAEVLAFCAKTGFSAVDMTGYYFSTYPGTPTDEEIYGFKRKAHEMGIEISGTGVRNEFSYEDDTTLNKEIDTVKRWIEVAAKMGAPVLRIFTAKAYSTGDARKKVRDRIVKALDACIPVAAAHGIILGIQNHNDFLHTADECFELINPFNSPWLGLVLDTGTFVAPDPYEEIRKATPLAVNWQLKEKLLIDGKQTLMDLPKLSKIIRECGYRGNVPIETLGLNDPLNEVPVFLEKVKKSLFD
jgi:sugar phosphate isomerase/epimerase